MTDTDQEKRSQLDDLIAKAAAKDAIKDFNAAAELYSEATELQAGLNGDLSLDNADLLYSYGKALYNVAVSKSDVLGSKVAGEQPAQSSAPAKNATSKEQTSVGDGLVKNAIASDAAKKGAEENEPKQSDKPFFQFTGDENFDESDSGEDEDAKAEGEDEDDDFANAFEVLDLARVLYLKKLDNAEDSGKGKSTEPSSDVKHIKERLADTYDLQAEISLEGERFRDAVTDLRTALELRLSLFPTEDPAVAECHYKLSLALEFGSVQKPSEEEGAGDEEQPDTVDEEMRKEAATQMEKAIESCKIRMSQEQKKLESDESLSEDKAMAMKRQIANVKEIVADMEQRLIDLRRPPVSVEKQTQESEAVLKGILGSIVGQAPGEQKAKLDAASQGANDLSSFVRRKPAKTTETNKRSAEQASQEGEAKRAKKDGE